MINRLDGTAKAFRNVQGLRAIAALLVVCVHLNGLDNKFARPSGLLHFTYPFGEWGVDLFFVISGFVMITSTWNEFKTPAISLRFLLRRLTRIYPAYWIALLPLIALLLVAPSMVNGSQTVRPSVLASVLLVPQLGRPILTISWTLVYEVFFYFVFALVLMFDRRWCLPLMAAWAALTLAANAVFPSGNIYAHVYGNTQMLEFVLGVCAGYLINVRDLPLPVASLVVGLIAFFAADWYYAVYDPAALWNGNVRFLVTGIPVLLIFNGVVGLETRYGYLLPAALQRIGNASYSLYLWHVPVSLLLARLTFNYVDRHGNRFVEAVWLVAVIAVAVAISLVLYEYIERPMLKFFGRWVRSLDARLPLGRVAALTPPLNAADPVAPR